MANEPPNKIALGLMAAVLTPRPDGPLLNYISFIIIIFKMFLGISKYERTSYL